MEDGKRFLNGESYGSGLKRRCDLSWLVGKQAGSLFYFCGIRPYHRLLACASSFSALPLSGISDFSDLVG